MAAASSHVDMPPVTWAQRKDSVYVTIGIPDCKDESITLTADKLEFR